MSKVIFVNRFYYPDQSATSQLLTDLASMLNLDIDTEIVVVASQRVKGDPNIRLSKEEQFNGHTIKRVYTTNFGKNYLLGRLVDFMLFYITSFLLLLNVIKKNDVVIVKTDPPLISVPVLIAVKIKHARQINWLQDMYPEVASRLGVKGFKGLVENTLFSIRNYVLKNSIYNVVLGKVMFDYVKSLGVSESNIKVVPNWSDGAAIHPVDKNSNHLIEDWGLRDKFVVCYSGNMGRAHEFDTILDAISILKNNTDIVFLFIGDGAKRNWIEEQAKERNLNNVIFKPYQKLSDLAFSLSAGDVHLISLIPELEGLIVPSKLYGVMAAGRPSLFIGSGQGEISKVLQEEVCGISLEIGDSYGLAEQIKHLYKDKDLLHRLSNNARSAYLDKYDKPVAINKWKTLIEDALS